MGEAFGRDATAAATLQGVVADGLGGLHAFFQIAGLQGHLTAGDGGGVARPDAGVAIGLKLQRDGIPVALGL
ncbi:hypothetical protein D3C80_1538160 [compost metagenome]